MPHDQAPSALNINTNKFPWPTTDALAEGLRRGEFCLATVIGQFNAVMRETLRIIEEYANDEIKANMERKNRMEKMDKLIKDLTEKCQGMQQAFLYKEEKYDEKCREVERYKVICELSANNAMNDDVIDTRGPEMELNKIPACSNYFPDNVSQSSFLLGPSHKRNYKSHTKIDRNSLHLSNYVDPLQDHSDTMSDTNVSFRGQGPSSVTGGSHRPYHPGSFTKPVGVIELGSSHRPTRESKLIERLDMLGSINVTARPRLKPEPLTNENIYQSSVDLVPRISTATDDDEQNKRIKVSLTGQSNEIMSSNKKAMNRMRQKITDGQLHRQIAGSGPYNRMALSSRRKKEWPF